MTLDQQKKKAKKFSTSKLVEDVTNLLQENSKMTWPEMKAKVEEKYGERISKSTWSGVRKVIENTNIVGRASRGQKIGLKEDANMSACGALSQGISNEDLEDWLVMMAVSWSQYKSTSLDTISNIYETIGGMPDKNKLRYRLNKLAEKGLLDRKKTYDGRDIYTITETTPILIKAGPEQLKKYVQLHSLQGEEKVLDEIAERIKILLGIEGESRLYIAGKLNDFQKSSLSKLDELLQLNYKEKKIELATTKNTRIVVSVGLIFYSPEINEFYMLGVQNKKEIIIRMSSIVSMKEIKEKNESFGKPEFNDYLDEMLGAETDQKQNVLIYFRNREDILERVKKMAANRKKAKITVEDNRIVYEDVIRGIGTLSRIIRSFGSDAIVAEPESLRKTMLESTEKVMLTYA